MPELYRKVLLYTFVFKCVLYKFLLVDSGSYKLYSRQSISRFNLLGCVIVYKTQYVLFHSLLTATICVQRYLNLYRLNQQNTLAKK